LKNVRKTLIAAAITGMLVTVPSAATANADVVGLDPNVAPAGSDVAPPPAPDAPLRPLWALNRTFPRRPRLRTLRLRLPWVLTRTSRRLRLQTPRVRPPRCTA
jgi:hypothetical protein